MIEHSASLPTLEVGLHVDPQEQFLFFSSFYFFRRYWFLLNYILIHISLIAFRALKITGLLVLEFQPSLSAGGGVTIILAYRLRSRLRYSIVRSFLARVV